MQRSVGICLLSIAMASLVHAAEPTVLPLATPTEVFATDDYVGSNAIDALRPATNAVQWTTTIDRSTMANTDAWITIALEISRDYGDTWDPLCGSRTIGGVLPGWDDLPSVLGCGLGTPASSLTLVRGTVHVYQCASIDEDLQCVGPSDDTESFAVTVRVD